MIKARVSRSLQGRLLALVLALVTLVWLSAAAMTWYDAQHELDELLDGHLAQTASLLIEHLRNTEHATPNSDHGEEAQVTPALHKYATKIAFQVFHEGVLVSRSAHIGSAPMTTLRSGFETVTRSNGTQWRVFATRGYEGDVKVMVAEETSLRDDILWAVLHSVLKPLLFALPLLVLAIWWSVRQGLMPLRLLGHAVSHRQPHATQPIALTDTPLEVQSLVLELNNLFERITDMMELERRFTADAAHELRTPIAAIRAQVQVAMGGDDAERERALNNTLSGCDRATRLVEQLLTLARLDAAPAAHSSTLDLAALTRRVASALANTALAKQQTLELDAPAAALLRGSETLLGVLVRNLLDNALRYSPAGASIHVSVDAQMQAVLLRVQDSGAGLSEEQMSHLGERFYRVLGSDQPGSGLGWSIVRRIALVHGAQVQVQRSARLGGLDVSVQWPHPFAAPR
ncbi:MAG: ATP-binding protein [Betaproteobacteria bacterium]